jgi:hypothetical protein
VTQTAIVLIPTQRVKATMQLNNIEEEVIFLNAIMDMINSMVNFEMLALYGADPHSEIRFETITHQRFFNIALVDFLSRTDKRSPVKQDSYLGALMAIVSNPNFNVNCSMSSLRDAVSAFFDWLNQHVTVDIWMPSIDTQATITISRLAFLKMCGNISKHNILRSVGVAEELQDILKSTGIFITLDTAMLALDDFYERFHTDILNYHSSTIAELLNDIRCGIFEYLQPVFRRSIVRDAENPPMHCQGC